MREFKVIGGFVMNKEAFEKLVRDELVRPTLLLLEKAGIVKVKGDKVVLTEKGKRYAETQLELVNYHRSKDGGL